MVFLLMLTPVFAYETSGSFIVTVSDKNIRVVSPAKREPEVNVIIKNETLSKMIGKLEGLGQNFKSHILISPGKEKSISLKFGKNLFFVPLTPPFQKIELRFGNAPHEIPPRQKN